MNPDISQILDAWPFEPGKINARMIMGEDGEPRIQVRLDLGLVQMFADHRPDGQEPFGFGSLLEFFEHQLDTVEDMPGEMPDGETRPEPLKLGPEDCRALREEAGQFYQRYLACLALEDYERVIRDTTRNLRVLDLVRKHAESEEDRNGLEHFRPYITMVRARALASQFLKENEPKAAIQAIDDGLENLRRHFSDSGQPQAFDDSNEVQMLRGMREALVPQLPVTLKAELRQRLARALEQENYELAAILRDELRNIAE